MYSLTQINDDWQPTHYATLLFILKGEQVLLIRKKRGLGAGKINGPGGKRDPGETSLACAVREVTEELCVVPKAVEARGRVRFQFTDGYALDVDIYIATEYEGTPTETAEAVPLWFDINQIPYDEMWADDRLWLARILRGEHVNGRFIFAGDEMLEHDISFDTGVNRH